jgi:uncharacterized protein YjbJ (UPF0337 family)
MSVETKKKLPEIKMNRDRCAGMWKQLIGSVKAHWGEVTDNPLVALAGTRDQVAGRIQERYGAAKEQSARQLKVFLARNRDWYFSNQLQAKPSLGPSGAPKFPGSSV